MASRTLLSLVLAGTLATGCAVTSATQQQPSWRGHVSLLSGSSVEKLLEGLKNLEEEVRPVDWRTSYTSTSQRDIAWYDLNRNGEVDLVLQLHRPLKAGSEDPLLPTYHVSFRPADLGYETGYDWLQITGVNGKHFLYLYNSFKDL